MAQFHLIVSLAIPEKVNRHAVRAASAVIHPHLANGEHGVIVRRRGRIVKAFHNKDPVHFTDAVGIFVAHLNGDIQLHIQVQGIPFAERTQIHILCKSIQFIGRSIVDHFCTVFHGHGELRQEVMHIRKLGGLSTALVIAKLLQNLLTDGVAGFIVEDCPQIDLDVIAVIGLVLNGDFLAACIAGHDTLEIVK